MTQYAASELDGLEVGDSLERDPLRNVSFPKPGLNPQAIFSYDNMSSIIRAFWVGILAPAAVTRGLAHTTRK